MISAVTRLPYGLERSGGWRDSTLDLPAGPGPWTDLLTGRAFDPGPVPLAALLEHYPTALLTRPQEHA